LALAGKAFFYRRQTSGSASSTLTPKEAIKWGQYHQSPARIDAALVALPAPFDASKIERAQRAVAEAQRALVTTEATYMKAVRDQQAGEEFRRRKALIEARLMALDTRMRRIEDQVGVWMLFAKCMSNDGLIALSIDDAGPTLSSLANDLLLACYGPRFTVSLKTLVETAKGEAREGFDIVVHDAESGEAKSVTQMSAGERVWINERLTRAIALHLTQNSGRHYETKCCASAATRRNSSYRRRRNSPPWPT